MTKKAVGRATSLQGLPTALNSRRWQGTGKANFPVQYDLSGRVEVIVKGSKTHVIGDCAFFLLRTSWTKFILCLELRGAPDQSDSGCRSTKPCLFHHQSKHRVARSQRSRLARPGGCAACLQSSATSADPARLLDSQVP